MNKEEIKHFKSLLRQGSLRHMNILLDDKFQKELLNIIKDYEKLQTENQQLKQRIDKAIDYIEKETIYSNYDNTFRGILDGRNVNVLLRILNGDLNE